MSFLNKIFVSLFCLFSSTCIADNTSIRGVATAGVEEIFDNGGLILVSEKKNTILMYNTDPKVCGHCNFFVKVVNETSKRQTFLVEDLMVTDQWGRVIPVRKKKSVVKSKERANSRRSFFHALASAFEAVGTYDHAGKVNYQETSHSRSRTHAAVGNRSGTLAYTDVSSSSREVVKGEFVDHSLRTREIREMQGRHAYQAALIDHENAVNLEKARDYYIDNHTLVPGEIYGANFQVIVPKEIQQDLQFINISYVFAGEVYRFTYRVGR
ncbi:MAG: hypothetical protein VX777_04555 [Chlamydiota bacterium]|nr:hypothetical protein [Chlamydiota bacterium]